MPSSFTSTDRVSGSPTLTVRTVSPTASAVGALLERAAELCGERTFATGTHVTDLHFSYLAPATTGPFRVIATPIRIGATTVLAQVELIDLGRDNRRCAVGTAQAAVATESTVQETMY